MEESVFVNTTLFLPSKTVTVILTFTLLDAVSVNTTAFLRPSADA